LADKILLHVALAAQRLIRLLQHHSRISTHSNPTLLDSFSFPIFSFLSYSPSHSLHLLRSSPRFNSPSQSFVAHPRRRFFASPSSSSVPHHCPPSFASFIPPSLYPLLYFLSSPLPSSPLPSLPRYLLSPLLPSRPLLTLPLPTLIFSTPFSPLGQQRKY
jgi:hypothetical protein